MTAPPIDPRRRLRRRLGVGTLVLTVTAVAGTGAMVVGLAERAAGATSVTVDSTQTTDDLQGTSAPRAANGAHRDADSGGS